MTMHPHIGIENIRERQREIMAQAERRRLEPWPTWTRPYGALGTYVARRGIGADGPIREHYLVTAFDTDDESRHLTEVGWPVFQTMPTR